MKKKPVNQSRRLRSVSWPSPSTSLRTLAFNYARNFFTCILLTLYASTIPAQEVANGFAAVAGDGLSTTTGGGNATPVTVTTYAQLASAVSGNTAAVIIVSGTINTTDGGGYGLPIGSNKTIMGANASSTIYGGIAISNASNIIIRNLNFHGIYPNSGPDDAISVRNSHHVWFDHLSVWDAGDGNLDITNESSYVTVSWCKFYYTNSSNGHRFNSLIGSGGGDHPEDWGRLKVTFHHNWFASLVHERMPRLMYGQAHTYNNYYTCTGNNYCIGVGSYGSMLVENNYFQNVNNPHIFMYDVWCYIVARGNVYDNTTGSQNSGLGGNRDVAGQESFDVQAFNTAPYTYALDNASNIPSIVTSGAGPFNGTTTPGPSITIQENGSGFCSFDGTIDTDQAGYTGTGYVNTGNAVGQGINYSVSFPTAGNYTFAFRYAANSARPGRLLIDGSPVISSIPFASTTTWNNWTEITAGTVAVTAGTHTIRLEATSASGTGNMDYMKVTGTGMSPVNCSGPVARLETSAPADLQTQLEIKCYPIPVRDLLRVEFNRQVNETIHISLMDATGKLMRRENIKGLIHNLDMSGLQKGIYLIKVTGTTVNFSKLITKQ